MKNLLTITTLYLLLTLSQAWSLPPCEGQESKWQNCEGSLTSASGTIYIGVFKDGIFEGKNEEKSVRYLGEYKNGTQNGQGTYIFPDGGKYVGELKDGKLNGQGTYTFADGYKYVGEWKDGKRNGQGTETYANGSEYVGEYKDDKKNGQGTETFYNGHKYVGEYKDDRYNGQGTYTFADGRKYVGELKEGKKDGQGTLTFADGEEYVGEWKEDKKDGQGTYTSANGRKYVGEWKEDKKDGNGTEISANGDKYVGEWKDDKKNGQGTVTPFNQQKFMVDLIAKTIKKNNSAVNSASKTRAWIKASNALCESVTFDAFGLKKKWSGRVSTINMDDDGSVNIRIDIGNGNSVQQYNIKNSLIDTVLDIPTKSMVQFSGYFVKGNMSENECLDGGLTASPDMLKEDFKFQFTEIESVTDIIK